MIARLSRLMVAPALLSACLAAVSSAQAGMITVTAATGGSAPAGDTYSTFDNRALGTTSQNTNTGLAVALANGAAFVNGNSGGQYAEPTFSGSNNQYFYSSTTAPANGADMTNYLSTGTGSITFTNAAGGSLGTNFGLLWGSVDTFNKLTINFADGSTSATLTGSQIGVANGSTSYYVNILASSAISSVVATSTSNSFEIDNVAFGPASVPEPASLAMVGIGLAGVGVFARKRRPV